MVVWFQVTHRDITPLKRIERERQRLIEDLRHALSQIKTLSGLLPICANCKRIRDDQGYWNQIEACIQSHSAAEFSHGICPECIKKHYIDLELQRGRILSGCRQAKVATASTYPRLPMYARFRRKYE